MAATAMFSRRVCVRTHVLAYVRTHARTYVRVQRLSVPYVQVRSFGAEGARDSPREDFVTRVMCAAEEDEHVEDEQVCFLFNAFHFLLLLNMSQHSSQADVASHRSRQAGANPLMSPQLMELFREELKLGIVEGVKAALAQQPPPVTPAATPTQEERVVVITREVPEGLASAWMSKYTYYPSVDEQDKLFRFYIKQQPSLQDVPDLSTKISLAIRNARAHVSRSVKEALPTVVAHAACPARAVATVRACVVSVLSVPCSCFFFSLVEQRFVTVSYWHGDGDVAHVPEDCRRCAQLIARRWRVFQPYFSQVTAIRIQVQERTIHYMRCCHCRLYGLLPPPRPGPGQV